MSCKACEDFQASTDTSYFRWKNANVEVRACEQHLTEVYEALRQAQRPKPRRKPFTVPEIECEEGGTCEFSSDLEHDQTGKTINCEKCGLDIRDARSILDGRRAQNEN